MFFSSNPRHVKPSETVRDLLLTCTVIDLREPEEREGAPEWILAFENVPSARWEELAERDDELLLVCAGGVRSKTCLAMLEKMGRDNAHAWTKPVGDLAKWR